MQRSIYIISGPAGAGKSTTSRILAQRFTRSAHIEGDHIDHMVAGGHEKPWLSRYHTDLIWLNILSLTKNFLDHDHDVIIDYVAFMRNAEYIAQGLQGRDVSIRFVIFAPSEEELMKRDAGRPPEIQMGYRCVAGLHELLESNPPPKHLLDTTNMNVEAAIEEIMNNDKYQIKLPGS